MIPYSSTQDTFQTQADDQFNSFSNPWNGVNANGGAGAGGQGWGIDSAYLTPAYLSPYRPKYQGDNGDPRNVYNPSFATSFNQTFNPFAPGGTNYGGSAYLQQTPFYDTLGYKPTDATVAGLQKYIVPTMMTHLAYKYLSKASNVVGKNIGTGLTRGLLGGVLSDSAVGNIAGKVGWAGGLASEMLLPMAVAQAGVNAVDHFAFKPYVAQRQMDNALTRNFAGVTFGDDSGNVVNGMGMSRAQSTKIAKELSVTAAKDMTFNQSEIAQLTDFAGRSGLLDNVNADQISERMKGLIKQVKVVMSAANTSDFKEAIEIMSKLQISGVDPAKLGKVMSAIGGLAKAAGTSAQKLMSTVGAQSEYLFQANGLTPYVGQLKAAQSYASFESAFRSGLISPALMARMGGKEGATQSAVAGMIGMGETPYASMLSYNALVGKGANNSIVGNVASFGNAMTKNPIEALGNFNLSRPALVSKLLEKDGMSAVENMLNQLAQVTPGAVDPKTGKVSAGAAYQMLTGTFGIPDDKARAMLEQLRTYQDPTAVKQMNKGLEAASIDSSMKFKDQNGMSMGVFSTPWLWTRDKLNKVEAGSSRAIGNNLESLGGGIDSMQKWFNDARYNNNDRGLTNEQLTKIEASPTLINLNKLQARKSKARGNPYNIASKQDVADSVDDIRKDEITSHHFSALKTLNNLAASGNKDAQTAITAKGQARSDALFRLSNEGQLEGRYKNKSELKDLTESLDYLGTNNPKDHAKTVSKIKTLAKAGDRTALEVVTANTPEDRAVALGKLASAGKIEPKYKDQANLANLNSAVGQAKSIITPEHKEVISKIKTLANAGDKTAIEAITADDKTKAIAISRLAAAGKIEAKYKDAKVATPLVDALSDKPAPKTQAVDTIVGGALSKVIKTRDAAGKLNQLGGIESAEYIGLMEDASRLISEKKTETPEFQATRGRIKEILGLSPKQELSIADVKAYADKAQVASMGSGVSHMGEIFKQSGIGSYKEFRKNMAGPGAGKYLSNLLGEKLTDEQAKAMSEQAILAKLAEKSGNKVIEASLDARQLKYLDPEELRRQKEEQKAFREEHSNIERLRKSGLIDFSTAASMQSAIDQKETVKKFDDATTKFTKAVEDFSKAKPADSGSSSKASTEGVGFRNSTIGQMFYGPAPRSPGK